MGARIYLGFIDDFPDSEGIYKRRTYVGSADLKNVAEMHMRRSTGFVVEKAVRLQYIPSHGLYGRSI